MLALALLGSMVAGASAADMVVYAAGAAKELVVRIDASFTQASGHRIKASFDTVGAQGERVKQGARPDVVILSSRAITELDKLGLIDETSVRDVGDVQVGLAVMATGKGSARPLPDISTADTLRQTLLTASSIAYADPARGATAGAHFAKVTRALGIADQLAGKVTVLPFGVEVIEAVAAGKYELGVSQSSEIMQHRGVRYIGALPAPHQLETRYQVAALKGSPAGALLASFLGGESGRVASRDTGFAQAR